MLKLCSLRLNRLEMKTYVTVYGEWNSLSCVWLYTVHGILQARILEWVAFPFSRGSSQPRDRTQVSRIVGRFFTSWAHYQGKPIIYGIVTDKDPELSFMDFVTFILVVQELCCFFKF